MRKILTIVGGVTLILFATVALFLIWYAPEGRRLDATSAEYASHLLHTALKTWDLKQIKSEASDQFLAAAPEEKLVHLLSIFSTRLGSIQSHGTPRGESRISVWNMNKVVTADYVVPVTFERAQGTVALRFVLNGDRWRLLAFNVNSEALLQ